MWTNHYHFFRIRNIIETRPNSIHSVIVTNYSAKTCPIGISFGKSNEDSHKDCWKDLEKWKMLDRQEIKERVGSLPKEKLPTI